MSVCLGERNDLARHGGGAIRTFIHAVTGAAPPPRGNGALFLARYDGDRFVSVAAVDAGADGG